MQRQSILTGEQLACLASPRRNEVFTILRSLKQGSVKEIADRTRQSPESTHYHVRALEHVGLVREAFRRAGFRKPEIVFEPTASRLSLPDLRENPELAPLTRKTILAGLRQVMRGYEPAAIRAAHNPDLEKHMHIIRANLLLSRKDARTFLAMIEAASRFAKDREAQGGVGLMWSSLVF